MLLRLIHTHRVLTFTISFVIVIMNSMSYSQSLPQNVTISVPRGDDGGFVTMILDKYSVRDTDHCKFYIDNQSYEVWENASIETANPLYFSEEVINETNYPVRTYRGYIVEEPNSVVVATIWPGNNTISAYVQEGQRYLWNLEELPINLNLNTGSGNVSVSQAQAFNYSSINVKSLDWVPTFGNVSYPAAGINSGPVQNGSSENGWKLIPDAGLIKMQVAFDVQPEVHNGLSNAQIFAQMEHGTNMLDLQFARDLGIQFRFTGVVKRMDTDALAHRNDAITIWRDLGLMDNPGSNNVTANSIPAQQVIYVQKGEGNPVAYESKKPLTGGNFVMVDVKDDDNGGLLHEVSHTWGGAHFVYPRDIMSGGGSWFGPTTNQRHIYIRNDQGIVGGLPVASSSQYNYNLHPYSTPDLQQTFINENVVINVLKNDFDSNGDDVKISTFDANSDFGGSVSLDQGKLVYTPPVDFIGRDQFTYTITDGALFNTTWVQVDVSNGGLQMRYDFEAAGTTAYDQSGANLNGTTENFTASLGAGIGNSNAWLFPDLGGVALVADNNRAFIDFGDVTDPFNASHSVSIWFKVDPIVLTGTLDCHIVANSSTAINKLISGYNIYIDKNTKRLTFEVLEMLESSAPSIDGDLRTIIGDVVDSDEWVHAVMVVDRSTNSLKAFMNGAQVGSTVALTPDGVIKGKPDGDVYSSGALGVCTYKPKKYTPFIGVMDEFRIYGRALVQDEVDSLFINPTDPIDVISVSNYPQDAQITCGASIDPSVTGFLLAHSPCYNSTEITYNDVTTNGMIVRTWTATDNCGNVLNYDQTLILITDDVSPIPSVANLSNITAQCEVTSITAPMATDNCVGTVMGTTNTVFPIVVQGTTIVTWNYEDGNGNVSSQTQTVIVEDNISPVPVENSLADISVQCEVASIPAPMATDNCVGTVMGTTNTVFPIVAQGTTVVTWNYEDGNGNVSSQTQMVIVEGVPHDIILIDDVTLNVSSPQTVSFQWIDCISLDDITGENTDTFVATSNGSYAVVLFDGNCYDTSECVVINHVGFESLQNGTINLFPNPTSDFSILEFNRELSGEVLIFSMDGKAVFTKRFENLGMIEIGEEILSGSYFILLKDDIHEQVTTLKWIKM